MANYKNLDAWKFSMQLVKEIYLLTKKFPKEELYALTSQMKRAAVSVPSILQKDWQGNTRRILYNFFIFQEDDYTSWKHY